MATDRTTTFGEVLAVAPGTLTDDVKARLAELYGSLTAHEFGLLSTIEVARRMQLALPESPYSNDDRYAAVQALQEIMLTFGFTVPLAELTLSQLLMVAADQPERYHDVAAALKARENVALASERTDGQWIVLSGRNSIDFGETTRYIRRLNGGFYWFWRWVYAGRQRAVLEEVQAVESAPATASAGLVEKAVRAAVKGSVLEISGSGTVRNGGIYCRLEAYGFDHTVRDVIILDGGDISGSGHVISVDLAPGAHLEVNGFDHDITERPITWEVILRRLTQG